MTQETQEHQQREHSKAEMTPEDCCLRGANRRPGEEQATGSPDGLSARTRLKAAGTSSSQKPRLSSSWNLVEGEPSEAMLSIAANRFLIDTCRLKSRRASTARSAATRTQASPTRAALGGLLISLIVVLTTTTQLANCSMCQHHQAMLDLAAASATLQSAPHPPQTSANKAPFETQNLVVCPKSSQYNNLPQFPARHVSPTLERQQREILKHLNASFANHLQLGASQPPVGALASSGDYPDSVPSELIDDELLNEIISPLVVDAAYERAKELIVKRRKLENELVRQGECHTCLPRLDPDKRISRSNIHPTIPCRLHHRHEQADGCGAPPARHNDHLARKRAGKIARGFRGDESHFGQKVSPRSHCFHL